MGKQVYIACFFMPFGKENYDFGNRDLIIGETQAAVEKALRKIYPNMKGSGESFQGPNQLLININRVELV